MAPAKKLLSNQPTTPKLEEEEEEDPEEEEESSGEGEEEEESDDEEQKEKPKTPENKASQVKQKPTIVEKHKAAYAGSGEEDEEEFEEAPHSPSASDFTIKLITPKNPKSKDSKPTSKRPSETSKSDEKELRRKKKAKVSEEDLKKDKSSEVVGAGRVWSEEDEIRVLHGMIDYQKKKGADPSADMAAFHDFVKGKLQVEVTRTQLYEKHRRLKQKYVKNTVKSEKGEALAFSKPHDTKIYGLSKRVWGVEKISNGVDEIENVNAKTDGGKVKAKKDAKVESKNIVEEEVNDDDDEGDFEKKYPFTNEAFSSLVGLIGSHNVSLLKAKLSVVGNATSREFEGNWKKLVEQESDIMVKKLRMYADQTERLMDESRRN